MGSAEAVSDDEDGFRAAPAQRVYFGVDLGIGRFHGSVVTPAARPRHLGRDSEKTCARQRIRQRIDVAVRRAPTCRA